MRAIDKFVSAFFICFIKVYQKAIAPFFMSPCRHVPSCSHYSLEAIRQHGSLKGIWLTLKRLAHCHPWGTCGFDPVPEKEKQCTPS